MGGVRERQRVGAYALVLDETDALLLCRMSSRTRTPGWWTLPGGGLRHGEPPEDADDTTDDARWFRRDAANTLDLSEHARYGVALLAGGAEAGVGRSGRPLS
ncbi:NUDIX hydrolase [Actinopolymorpha sp. NPDC004070]|uniref:NUDIX hydrolase n=1 Tax=Actinopolymorpha sp. NPDC004070 TaxID=3154548 RepID=UPI0033B0921E